LPDDRWRLLESAFWLVPVACFIVLPSYLVLLSQVLIAGLFAVSLDLVLGYAGIVSLGHAAFFGLGAYTAGLLPVHGWAEPLTGLVASGAVAALAGYATSFLVVRGSDLTRLMVTLGIGLMFYEAANRAAFITGGVDGLSGVVMWRLLGLFKFDLGGKTASSSSFCSSSWRGASLARPSGSACVAFAKTKSACPRSALPCAAAWSRFSRSRLVLPESPGPFWLRPPNSSGWKC
jgi:branched-chain amino acid transport system permease protein